MCNKDAFGEGPAIQTQGTTQHRVQSSHQRGQGGGDGRTRTGLRWLTLIKERAGTSPCMSSLHTVSTMLSQKCLKWKPATQIPGISLDLEKKYHLHWKLCLHSYHEEYNIQYVIRRKARHKKNLSISFNLKRDRTGPIWYTIITLLCLSTNTMYRCL